MADTARILQWASLGPELDAELAARYAVLDARDAASLDDALLRRASDVAVVVTSVRKGLTAAIIERLPRLRAVCSWGVGYDTLDVAAAGARGVRVSNTPGVLDECVADLAWALLLSTARRTAVGDRHVKDGNWRTIGAFPLSTRVWGQRLGILGMGRIGAAIAQRGAGFRMEVRYTNRNARRDSPFTYEPSLLELARWADFLVLACPGGDETRHLVDAPVLHALGGEGILINIARGSVVDERALVAALVEGKLGGAGLDVFEHEPRVPPELMRMDQVVLMPHVGSATHQTRNDMARLVFDNVVGFMQAGQLLTPIEEPANA